MSADIRKLLAASPFVPFTIHLADGDQMRVPTSDHVFLFPTGSRLIVTHDDDTYDMISALLISRLTVDAHPADLAA